MKKFTILTTFLMFLIFGFAMIGTAQNLALNGGFESWTINGAPGPADNWDVTSTSLTGAQETTIVRTGTYSTNLTWTTTSTVYLEQYIAVTAGNNYNFSFWALDNDPGGRARVAVRWFDVSGSFISGFYGDYTVDSPNWQELSSGSQTAAVGAVEAHIEIRVYDVSGWPGTATVYVDDADFVEITSLEINKAYAISETAMDILYSASVSTVNPADYSLTGTTAITFSGATIDGSNSSLVHLTGASVNMAGDITVDNIADAANADNYDFYAGIMPVAFVNTTNPGGTMNNTEIATFQGIVSADDDYNNVWFSDAAGAYNGVLIYSSSFDGLVDVGDEIILCANRTTYNGLSELEYPELISILSSGNSPYGPDIISGSDINETIPVDTEPGEKWEGQLVTIENFTVDSYVDYDYTCSWSDGSTTYIFHVGDNVAYQFGGITLNIGETYGSISGVVDWHSVGPYYRINPREQADIVPVAAAARIVGSMNGWNTTNPDYVMALNANGLYELIKSLDAGDHEYKVLEGNDWSAPNYPGNNQHVILTGTEDVTWKANITAELVTHMNPVIAGNFMSAIGGNDWDPGELMGEMTDPDGDDIFTVDLTIPAGNYEGKVTLNHNWDQSTGGNVAFLTDGVNPTTFTYDFPNNITLISGPPPDTALITFIVEDIASMNYDGFFLKGSWDASGQYDPSWGGGDEHSAFYDDGTHGDVVAGDHIWTCQLDLVVDGGSNTWEWGVNDTEHNWIAGNWQFTVPDQTPQTLTWLIPDLVDLVINEIMYNSIGTDEEWIELYNNTDQTIDLENWQVCDNSATNPHIVIPAGYSVAPGSYFTISVSTGGAFPFTPDYDGTGYFGLNNTGDAVRVWNANYLLVDIVNFDDTAPWPTEPDGNGPSLSLINPNLDNSLAASWKASHEDNGTPGAINFPINIITPNGGEIIELGTTYDITWTVEDWDGNIMIELIRDGQDPVLLVSNMPVSDLSFSWYVFESFDVANDYKILITNMIDGNPYDESDDYFSLIEAYVMPEIVITEIMYNPPESGTDSLEFLELYNNGTENVNLAGFHFTAGIEYIFPSIDLLPDNYLLVSVDSAVMFATFGVEARQWTGGALSNSGEKLELRDSFDNVIDSLTYDDYLPWDTLADGYGPSLTLCNPNVDNSVPENWTHSINFAAVNSAGDSIWATPGFGCQVVLLPGFDADVTFVSVGDSVLFTDLTVGNPIEWTWTFEGGTPESWFGQTPPYIIYNEVGTWDVTLLVSDGVNTAEITYQNYIEVVDFPAPTNLEAVVGPYDDVQLTWNAPGPVELIYDNDIATGAYSYEGYTMATHMSPVSDCKVLALKFYTQVDPGDNTFNVTIYGWDGTQPGTEVIYMETATAVDMDWVEIDVSSQNINFTDDFVVGFGSINATTFLGYDANLNNGRSWDFDNVSSWDQWAEAYLIRAIVEYSNGKIAEIGMTSSQINNGRSVIENIAHPKDYGNVEIVEPITNQYNNFRDLLGYNVYRDDIQINATIVEVTEYNDPEPTIGSHDYYVAAVYDGGESDPSNVVSIIVTDISEVSSNSVMIYPNPTDGIFTIQFAENVIVDVVIMDITGKEVYKNTINKTSQVNISSLHSGLYFVRLLDNSSNNILVKKLIIR
ncbi:MAG: lamin tail domain-containing protein [Bacteroidetes bacterium]|nr:lamin tail domain-containing protein [Bacteroidota bacterium]MBL6944127.1 lamin tail domain-containing protein [Bacteroidales bacterium]